MLCSLVDVLSGDMFAVQSKDRDLSISSTTELKNTADVPVVMRISLKSYAKDISPGVLEVMASLGATAMNKITDISALDFLELGSRRWNSQGRGQATMSAVWLTLTEWYEHGIASGADINANFVVT